MADKMSCRQFILPALLLPLWTTVIQAQSTSRLHDTCVYSFSVPKAQLPQSSLLGSGCPGMTELQQEFEELKRRDKLQQEQIVAMMTQLSLAALEGSSNVKPSTEPSEPLGHGAVTYIRWGRTVCPAHAQRIYVGYVGSSHFEVTAGGANYLCLAQTPEWTNKREDGYQGGSKIFGVKYRITSRHFSTEHNSGQSFYNNDVPCTACHVPQRSAQIMIPGLVNCPAGWVLEYKGYLVTAPYEQKHPLVYECLDEAPEVINGRRAEQGALMHMVEAHCGSLPCSNYVTSWEMSCVVCTK